MSVPHVILSINNARVDRGIIACWRKMYTTLYIKHVDRKTLFQFSFTIIIDQFLITIRSWCWSMIHILDY